MDQTLGPDEYRCAMCQGVFVKAVSDDEAEAEYAETFPAESEGGESRDLVCDECYRRIVPKPSVN